jgi:hypothetical protein
LQLLTVLVLEHESLHARGLLRFLGFFLQLQTVPVDLPLLPLLLHQTLAVLLLEYAVRTVVHQLGPLLQLVVEPHPLNLVTYFTVLSLLQSLSVMLLLVFLTQSLVLSVRLDQVHLVPSKFLSLPSLLVLTLSLNSLCHTVAFHLHLHVELTTQLRLFPLHFL